MDQAIMFRVRERAYQIWAAQGGDAEKNWLQAESEILQLNVPQAAPVSLQKPKTRGVRNRKTSAATKAG
jgi:hypothetical protein